MLLLCILVGGVSNAWAQTYKKVTSAPSNWAGEYLIVYEKNATEGYVWTGVDAASCYVTATISNEAITKPSGAVSVTIASMTGGYSIKVNGGDNNGKYIQNNGNSNGIKFVDSGVATTFTYENSSVTITCGGKNFRYNDSSNNNRFRYFGSAQQLVQLYKLAYTVTYDANGGTGTMTDTSSPYFGGSTVTVKSNGFTRDGYTFTGWNTKANGSGTPYAAGATFDISENTTLYAQWVAAGDYINSTPTSADIDVAGDVAEFSLSTNLADPSYAIKYYTTADGDVETSKPGWFDEVEFSGSTLDITVLANTGAARTAYFKVYSGETYSDVITINQAAYVAVTGVTLDITSKTLLVDGTVTLEATVNPDNASYKTVTWESDDEDVATVNSSGKVTAVAAGTATITVKSTDDPTKSATCTITVTDGSINLDATGEIEITSFPSFSGTGYQSPNPYTIGDYDWIATNCMLSSSYLQLRKSDGVLTSPTIKSTKGFTVTVTVPTNSVTVSDGTNNASTSEGVATLTTTKTSTTITISAGSSYAQVSKITITPSKDPVATEVTITDPGTLTKDATGTFAYTVTTEEDNTASWTSATTGVITITNAATGAYTAAGRGTSKITLTLTPTDATTYRAVTAERTVTVMTPVEVLASDVEMTYGDAAKAIGATISDGYAGTLTYESGNTSIATVDASGKVTAVAAGTTTITISAPADASHYYTAGEDVEIEVTVNAPAGGTTAKTTTPVEVIYNTLLSSSLPTGWTGDGEIWSGSSSFGAVTALGTIGNSYDLKTPSINLNGNYTAASVTFEHTGNKTFSTSGTGRADACKLYVKDGDTETQLTISTMFAGNDWTYVTNTTDLSAYIGKNIQLIFRYTPSNGNQGKWEVKNFVVNATPAPTESVTLSKDGFATYCSIYSIDFSETSGYTAWRISDISAEGVVTFTKITEKIKGGQGVILYNKDADGVNTSTATIKFADGTTEFTAAENLLVGTTAPTFVNQVVGDYTNFALSAANGDFRKIKAEGMVVPANKAYLPVPTDKIPKTAARLTFVFEDGEQTTGISEECRVKSEEFAPAIYDLQGRKVAQPKKGLYIVNGRKVVMK